MKITVRPKDGPAYQVQDEQLSVRDALKNLMRETQIARNYIVISEDAGFEAYTATAQAIVRARAALAMGGPHENLAP